MCRAARETLLDTVNGGSNGGRICWAVAGTLGVDEPDMDSCRDCHTCEFHRQVIREELPELIESAQAVGRLGYSSVVVLTNGLTDEDDIAASGMPAGVRPGDPRADEHPNCWEFMKCGRGPKERRNTVQAGCRAAIETRLDGVHGGINGGRACWALAGTKCNDRDQDEFAQKRSCTSCEFYKLVLDQQMNDGPEGFLYTTQLRRLLAEHERTVPEFGRCRLRGSAPSADPTSHDPEERPGSR